MKRHCLSTLYGVGLIRVAPGTFGSLVAALLAYLILLLPLGYIWLAVGGVLFLLLGAVNAHRFIRERNTSPDPSEIVIDELVGQWFTYTVWHGWLVAITSTTDAARRLLDEVAHTPMYLVAGFLLFRLFDIIKPWPISWADRRIKGGFGVMFDDVLAALAAGTLLYVLYLFSPYLAGQLEVNP
ncbi:MAG: phosphatidylglycerophosphatase A [Alphaproteobacteria bacterium]|nr:phosphatidylglycerophosphatase A [Alphaproteobacteria bacterium]